MTDDRRGRRRLLLITQTFHPVPGVSSLRASAFADLLPDLGWDVDVVTRPYGPHHEDTDAGGLHGRNRVRYLGFRAPLWDPRRASVGGSSEVPTAGSRWRRALLPVVGQVVTMPDNASRIWTRELPLVVELAERLRPDAVLSTSPQHSVQIAGRAAARAVGRPWVVDLRDPITGDPRYGAVGWRRLRTRALHRFEQALYRDADAVVHAVPSHHERSMRHFGRFPVRQELIPNGFPEELSARPVGEHDRTAASVRVCVAGKVGSRELVTLLEAVGAVSGQHPGIELTHLGEPAPGVDAAAIGSRLGSRYRSLGLVSHRDALEEIAAADVLVSVLSVERSRAGLLSSKLFEYGATGRPIVAVNPTRDDRAMLESHPRATLLDEPTSGELAAAIEWAVMAGPVGDDWLEEFRATNSRQRGASRLAELLDDLVAADR